MEKSVSEQKLYDHNKEVEELASYETTEVDVVPDMILYMIGAFSHLIQSDISFTCYEYS